MIVERTGDLFTIMWNGNGPLCVTRGAYSEWRCAFTVGSCAAM